MNNLKIVPVYSGSFNPPTLGHFATARTLEAVYGEVVVIVSVRNPLKKDYDVSFDERLEMCRQTFPESMTRYIDTEKILCDTLGLEFAYTYQLIEYLNEEVARDCLYVPAIGGDSLNIFNRFYEWKEIVDRYGVISVRRPGYKYNDFAQSLVDSGAAADIDSPLNGYFSSTDVRNMIAAGNPEWKKMVSRGTEDIILRESFYSKQR